MNMDNGVIFKNVCSRERRDFFRSSSHMFLLELPRLGGFSLTSALLYGATNSWGGVDRFVNNEFHVLIILEEVLEPMKSFRIWDLDTRSLLVLFWNLSTILFFF